MNKEELKTMPNPVVPRPCRVAEIQVVGHIWMPTGAVAAYVYPLSDSDLKNIEEWSREAFEDWLSSHSGDFSDIIDFRVQVGNEVLDWKDEESAYSFSDCMWGDEE